MKRFFFKFTLVNIFKLLFCYVGKCLLVSSPLNENDIILYSDCIPFVRFVLTAASEKFGVGNIGNILNLKASHPEQMDPVMKIFHLLF